jgi:hypothetical protein
VGDSVVCSGFGLSQQSLEFGEDLLDRIEVGRVFGQSDKRLHTPAAKQLRPAYTQAESVKSDEICPAEYLRFRNLVIGKNPANAGLIFLLRRVQLLILVAHFGC